jgi:hypothetical protein
VQGRSLRLIVGPIGQSGANARRGTRVRPKVVGMDQWFLPDPNGISGAYIYPGGDVTWDFGWPDVTFGPAILAVAMPGSLVSSGGDVVTASNGFYQDNTAHTHYTTRLTSTNGGGYRLLISRLR